MNLWPLLWVTTCVALSSPAQALSLAAFDNEYLAQYTENPRPGTVTVTFLGTTTLLFDDGVTQILVDGFLTRPPLATVALEPLQTSTETVDGILDKVNAHRVRGVFVTHSHYDHALDAVYIARRTGAPLFGSSSTLNLGRGERISEDRLNRFVRGERMTVGKFEVTAVPAKHSPTIPFVNDDLGEKIRKPLTQPLRESAYVEGGTYSLYIRHGAHTMLVVASANYVEGALHGIPAETVFLSIGAIGTRSTDFHRRYYDNTVGCVRPSLVVPVHWDEFFEPLSTSLSAMPGSNTTLRYVRERLRQDHIQLGVMRGLQKVKLFDETSRIASYPGPAPGCEDYD
ncbi:MBL fold metallo-hydrolase [Caballeronia novacaledonica]|uniref:MBL fold metallo-hydrolase n=1 Tax=Caballeronia novacaledonica TaxID=1544861 RepID=UPI001EE1D0BC|nr:MBL fold metallo-hydrolase [Caballeronia novacaledonica]GJH08285.1 MBL fold metallo-hydrolase [Caballeronia novacaledonica]